ncbi:MAG: RsmB/NOP family class I SAM-dependent RNA methyltransferase [Bdellovibrionales bacterium]
MRVTPKAQAEKFATKLISDPVKREQFLEFLFQDCEQTSLICLSPETQNLPFETLEPFPQQPSFIQRPKSKSEATKSPLHEQGAYYCLDYSSVLEALPLTALKLHHPVVLDLCAAPGGKSLFAWRALQPSLLLSNEVTQSRVKMLISNIKRCGVKPVKILSQAPQKLVERLESSVNVLLIDAPCTGQSLVAKKQSAPGAFSTHQINGNAMRQRGIISSGGQMLASGGYLLYTTCTYSREENEDIIEWFLKKNDDFESVAVPALLEFQSEFMKENCYRFWPDPQRGAGGFSCLLRRKGDAPEALPDLTELPHVWANI